MNSRVSGQSPMCNSLAIRQEIQRFESVHPSIYAIYDLIEVIPDTLIQQQIREHVVCIEDSFVNSQEWTISRSVQDLKLGILGSVHSGKSALVHRYLTGSYMQEESPEGGRFKKEVVLDGQSYLLLIRDEGGAPEMQFTHWVDAIIFVFSLENEPSFNSIYSYYAKMAHYRKTTEIPLILVGTQDSISESNPRVIDDSRARKLANDLKHCSYYETCATYGLNVERVFQDACQKILQMKLSSSGSRPNTPNHGAGVGGVGGMGGGVAPSPRGYYTQGPSQQGHSPPMRDGMKEKDKHKRHNRAMDGHDMSAHTHATGGSHTLTRGGGSSGGSASSGTTHPHHTQAVPVPIPVAPELPSIPPPPLSNNTQHPPPHNHTGATANLNMMMHQIAPPSDNTNTAQGSAALLRNAAGTPQMISASSTSSSIASNHHNQHTPHHPQFHQHPHHQQQQLASSAHPQYHQHNNDLPTPTSTPILSRKSKSKSANSQKNKDDKNKNGEVGSGRAIPIKQGHLRKWGTKPLNKEWKRKYVTLTDNGKLTYHQTINDYMDDVPGKEINLVCTTVKIPGMKPRGSRGSNPPQSTPPVNGDNPAGPGFDSVAQRLALNNCDESVVIPNASLTANGFFLDGVEYPLPPSVPPNHPSMGSSYPPHPSSHHIIHSASAPGGVGGMPGGGITGGGASGSPGGANKPESHTPNVKKRHRRAKSGHNRKNDPNDGDDSDDYEFVIVSIENKSWQFAATSVEERDDWVNAIEQQILSSLQANISTKTKTKTTTKLADTGASQLIRVVNGNYYCVDCEAPNPDWASLNLGVLMCIECSGSHRNLGVHLSRVRSLDLDDWCPEHVPVMVSIGNTLANSIWEANLHNRQKPQPNSPREDKEKWIRDKYADKLFLPPLPYVDVKLSEQLIDAVARQNIQNAIIVLAYTTNDHVNTPYSDTDTRTALHIASALGNPALVQLLIWYGADVSLIDHEGRNALWYARSSRSTECVDVLCAAGCVDNTKPPPRPNLITTAPGIGPMGPPTNSNVGLDYHHRRGGALPPPPPVQSHHS